jgi:hypothetical protein
MFKRDSASPVTRAAVAAALATTVVILPQLPLNEGQLAELPEFVGLAWLGVLLTAAPVTAYVVARRSRRGHRGAIALAGIPQVLLVVALIRLDIWLEVRSGYLLPDSGEEAMAYGLGTIIGALLGLLLAVLVTTGALLGSLASRRSSRPTTGTFRSDHGNAAVRPDIKITTSSPRPRRQSGQRAR